MARWKNDCDDGNYGYMEPIWKIKFNDIMDKKWGDKSSPEEESDNLVKLEEEGFQD
jgi:hypothetical protein